jgi:MFS family permease
MRPAGLKIAEDACRGDNMITGLALRPRFRTRSDDGALIGALSSANFRTYLIGQSLAYAGSWMQSVAQDWLVLQLSHSAIAVGVTMALQFLPTLLFSMYGGVLADRFVKRRILMVTQTLNAAVTGFMAVVTITGNVEVTYIYVFALTSGLIGAVDSPARQVFVTEVAPAAHLRGAISLNSAVFQASRLVAPAIATALISGYGTGWVFAVNALCYIGPTVGLLLIHPQPAPRAVVRDRPPRMLDAVRYVSRRPPLAWTIFLVGMVGTFGLNFPIVLTGMASQAFHAGVGMYGLFNIVLAVGSVAGALGAGVFPGRRLAAIAATAAAFGALQAAAALAPSLITFVTLIILMGVVNLAFQSMAASSVQLWTDPALRGRVMGLYVLVFIGGTPIGAPLIGAVCVHFGARAAMFLCGVVPALSAVPVALSLVRGGGAPGRGKPRQATTGMATTVLPHRRSDRSTSCRYARATRRPQAP